MPSGRASLHEGDDQRKEPLCSLHSVAVQTSDFDTAYDFYTRVVGLAVVREPFKFKTRTLAWLCAGPGLIELYSVRQGMEAQPYDGNGVGPDHLAFVTSDLDKFCEHLRRHNVTILRGPLVPPSGDPNQPRVLFVQGPDGDELLFREPEVGGV